jgi:hypothetical protein
MLPELQTVLSYFQAQADILRHDYGDILRIEMQSVDEFIDAATNLCQKISPKSTASLESGRSPSASVDTQTVGTDSEPESLPEIVMEFHRWAQGPPPPWLQEFEQFRSKMARPATRSVTEADIESVTEPDTEFERLLRSKTQSRAESITESDTESVTEPDTEFERLLRSKTQLRAESVTESDTESVTEPDTEFERPLRSMTQRRAESVTEPDTDSESKNFCRTETTTNPEYSLYRALPAEFATTITQLIGQLYDLRSSASRTVRELRALASGAEFCCIMFLFMLVFIRINGRNACGPENESDFNQVIKLSARRLFEALDHLKAFVAVCFSSLSM